MKMLPSNIRGDAICNEPTPQTRARITMSRMKTPFPLIAAVLLAPLAASAQEEKNTNPAKPEVALANQATRIAWENAPEEKKKSWQ
ncbi:hypothetical protein EBT11_08470, partial [bacterium]|nr:hypothetical protein [bacterium]NBV97624.1 hypothetical protein [Verrucomicrobiota bacterium]